MEAKYRIKERPRYIPQGGDGNTVKEAEAKSSLSSCGARR